MERNNCPKCDKVYLLTSSLKTHLLSHVNDDKYCCSECLKPFPTEMLLKEHSASHSKEYENSAQDFLVEVVSELQGEVKEKCTTEKENTGCDFRELVGIYQTLHRCPKCPVTFIRETELETHLSSHSYDTDIYGKLKFTSKNKSITYLENTLSPSNECSEELKLNRDIKVTYHRSVSRTYGNTVKSRAFGKTARVRKGGEKACAFLSANKFENICEIDMNDKSEKYIIPREYDVIIDERSSAENSRTLLENKTKCCENQGLANSLDLQHCVLTKLNHKDVDIPVFDELKSETTVQTNTINSIRVQRKNKTNLGDTSTSLQIHTNISNSHTILYQCIMCPMIFLDIEEIKNHLDLHKDALLADAEKALAFADTGEYFDISEGLENESFFSKLNDVLVKRNSSVIKINEGNFVIHLKQFYNMLLKCIKCPMVFLTKDEFLNHLPIHSDETKIYKERSDESSLSFKGLENVSDGKSVKKNSKKIIDEYTESMPVFQCLSCLKIFFLKSELKGHVCFTTLKRNIEGDVVFQCVNCQKVFNSSNEINSHTENLCMKQFECVDCEYKCKTKFLLRKHIKMRHSRPYECTACGDKFKTEYILELHQREHSDVIPYKCSDCEKAFKNEISLTLHRYDHLENGNLKCDICKYTSESVELLKQHLKTHIKGNSNESEKPQLYLCTKCDVTFAYMKKYRLHIQCHSNTVALTCNLCQKEFPNLKILKQHIITHTRERSFQCSLCNKKFSFRSSFNNHMDTHAGHKRYLCHICGISLNQRSTYYSHLKNHTGVKHHKCSICQKRFFYKGSYNRHMAMHLGKKPYQCKTCGKHFKQNTHLKNHVLIHTGEKPHVCHICNKSFIQKASLTNHLLTHHEGQFDCEECGKKMKHAKELLNHLKKKTDGKLYECHMCNSIFTKKTCLNHHKKCHTSENSFSKFGGPEEIIGTVVEYLAKQREIIITQNDSFCPTEEIIAAEEFTFEPHEEIILTQEDSFAISEEIITNQRLTYENQEEIIVAPIDLLESDNDGLQVHLVF